MDITPSEVYKIIDASKQLPVSSQVASVLYSELFEETWKAGYTDLIQVTLNSKGSGTYQAAVLSRNLFFEEHPEAREQLAIHIIDSKTYSMAYGIGVIEGAQLVQTDASAREVIAQPGLRYAQADALIRSLLLDETFSALSLPERTAVQERILTEIRGRMLEDIVLLETKLANPKKQVFVLQFSVGEFDMVVFDPVAGSCQSFEIKHSTEIAPQQYRHLIDEEKCAQTEHRYGPITGKFVLYRGESQVVEGIQYRNVEEYLRSLA